MKKHNSKEGQLHTLEGLAGSIVLLLAITYALSAVVVTPTSDIKPGTDINQRVAQDVLESSSETGDLKQTLTHWNVSNRTFINSTDAVYYYENEDPDTKLGNVTNETFTQQGLLYNIDVRFLTDTGTGSLTLVDKGEPGPSAVTATQTVVLADDDNVTSASGQVAVNNTTEYPIPKEGERVYNRAEVKITVW